MAQREKSRESDILNAATELFTEKGFHKATIEDIAERAGIGKGTVYEYFKNKNSLFIEMMRCNLSEYHAQLEQQLKAKDEFVDKLYSFIHFHHQVIQQNINSINLMLQTTGPCQFEEGTRKQVFELFMESRNMVIAMIAEILSLGEAQGKIRDVDKGFAGDIFYAMVTRCCMRFAQYGVGDEQIKKEKDSLVEMFIRGVG